MQLTDERVDAVIEAARLDSGIAVEVIRRMVLNAVEDSDRAALRLQDFKARMQRIEDAHAKDVDRHGGTTGYCRECNWAWPCPTYVWTTDFDRDLNACWNPHDDEDKD